MKIILIQRDKINIDDIIIKVDDFDSLYVIPAGTVPPNPTELILNGKLDELMKIGVYGREKD